MPVQNNCGGFGIVVAGFMWLLLALYGVGGFWPFPDFSGRFQPDRWIAFLILPLFRSCLMVQGCSRLFWPGQVGCGVSGIVAVGSTRLSMVLYRVGWF